MKRPMLIFTLALTLGILLSYNFLFADSFVLILFLFLTVFMIISILKNKDIWNILVLYILLLGVFLGNYATSSKLEKFEGIETQYTGIVTSLREDENKSSFTVEITQVNGLKVREKIILNSYDRLEIMSGDIVEFTTRLNKPSSNTNPYLFNYRKYLLTNKIHFTSTIKKQEISRIGRSNSFVEEKRNGFKEFVEKRFDQELSAKGSAIMKGIILGDGSYLEEQEYDKYRELGLAHILAVSGLHIGIISSFLIFLLSRIGIKRYINIPITILFLVIYGYLISFPPATFRAIIMFTLIYLGRLIYKPVDLLNIIFASAFVALLINPMWIFSIGFLLSYGAIIAIAIFGRKVKSYFYPYKGKIIDGLSTTIAVSIGILPIQVYNFNEFPIYSFISNILVIPIVTINVIFGFLLILFKPIAVLLNLTINIQSYIIDVFSKLPFGTLKMGVFSVYELILYLLLLALWQKFEIVKSLKWSIKFTWVWILVFLSIFSFFSIEKSEEYKVHFIDVGQGDAILIQGKSNILIDGGGSLFGSFDVGKNITLPYLEKHGVNKLDTVILTHYHEDHFKGLIPIMEELKVSLLVTNNDIKDYDLQKIIKEKSIPQVIGHSDLKINSKDISIDFIWPHPNENYRINENNNSLVSVVSIYDWKILFTGDIEKDAEMKLRAENLSGVSILKVPHHGSKTSSTINFINKVSPNDSIISVGRNNNFGHPSMEVISRLAAVNSNIYRTDKMGRVLAIINKDTYSITNYTGPFYKENPILFIEVNLFKIIYYCTFLLLSYIITIVYKRLEESSYELHRIY